MKEISNSFNLVIHFRSQKSFIQLKYARAKISGSSVPRLNYKI